MIYEIQNEKIHGHPAQPCDGLGMMPSMGMTAYAATTVNDGSGSATIKGGNIQGSKSFWIDDSTVTLAISGGTINGAFNVSKGNLSISGGTFNNRPNDSWIATGYRIKENSTGVYTIEVAPTYTVALNTNGGTINSGNISSYTEGTGATLPTDVTKTGYTFADWYDNSELSGTAITAISKTDTEDKTYWAKWTRNTVSYTVTFKVANGSWDDGTTADKTVTLSGDEGDTLTLESTDIPAVGNNPNTNYKSGSWDTTPSASTAIAANMTYIYTYVAKGNITPSVSIEGWTYGETANEPTVTGNSGNGAVITELLRCITFGEKICQNGCSSIF